jgi:hypothetical protein
MLTMMLGREGILLAYLFTVVVLSPSFFFGRLLSPPILTRALARC